MLTKYAINPKPNPDEDGHKITAGTEPADWKPKVSVSLLLCFFVIYQVNPQKQNAQNLYLWPSLE